KALILQPNSGKEHNDLAWQYGSGPSEAQVPGLATLLAEKAVLLEPRSWHYRNTLGVAYYRLGRWPQSAKTLEDSLRLSQGRFDAFALFFLAMTYQRLGQASRANECYQRADRWRQAQRQLSTEDARDLAGFRAEASALLGLSQPEPRPVW